MSASKMKTVLVTDDPICVHNYYRGNRQTADSPEQCGFRLEETPGGALLLCKLIAEATKPLKGWGAVFGLDVKAAKQPRDYSRFLPLGAPVEQPIGER